MMSRDDMEAKLLDYFLGELDEREENEILQRVAMDEEFRELFYLVCSRHLGHDGGHGSNWSKGKFHK